MKILAKIHEYMNINYFLCYIAFRISNIIEKRARHTEQNGTCYKYIQFVGCCVSCLSEHVSVCSMRHDTFILLETEAKLDVKAHLK